MVRAGWHRPLFALGAAAAVAGLAISAVLAPGLPGEGGKGAAILAVPAVPVAPVDAGAISTPVPAETTTTLARPTVSPAFIATVSVATPYAWTPGGPVAGTLPALNPFKQTEVVAVIGAPGRSGWLHVELPIRPNGSTGWIQAAGVRITQTLYKVHVSLAARTLTVSYGAQTVLRTSVAVGAPKTPTPPGNTYLWELIRPDNPNGAYGPYIFGLGWYSDAYSVFNGGDAQIGIHGQDEPWSIGYAESHGCVRLPNSVMTTIAGILPLGTPVTITS